MSTAALLEKFHHAAANPAEMKEKYLKRGQKIVLINCYAPGGNCMPWDLCRWQPGRRYRN